MGSYLTGRAQRVRVDDYYSEAEINDVLDIFENVRVLANADDLK
jgi:hypothetical protein